MGRALSILVPAPFPPGSPRKPSLWADEVQRLSQNHTSRVKRSQNWTYEFCLQLPGTLQASILALHACIRAFIHSFILSTNIRSPHVLSIINIISHSSFIFYSFIHSFHKHSLNTYFPDGVLGPALDRTQSVLGTCTQQVSNKKRPVPTGSHIA